MAGVGIWLWANPAEFGTSPHCPPVPPPSISVFGHNSFFDSGALRIISLIVYAVVAIPGVNLIAPMLFLFGPYFILNLGKWTEKQRARLSCRFLLSALVMLLAINVIFVIDTELAISRNEFRQAGQDNIWTLGQVLALLLVVLPLKSLLVYLWFSTQLGTRFGKTDLGDAMKGFQAEAKQGGEDGPWDEVRRWIWTIGDTPGTILNISSF
jgi:hypothetical protein